MRLSATRYLPALALLVLATAAPCAAQQQPFAFSSVDLKLLEEVELLDSKLEKEGFVYTDAGITEYVTKVGMAVVPTGPSPERVAWRFRVLRDPLPNAFALPNGSIYIHSGLLSLLQNEEQLAGVLAHEVTHVTDRHSFLYNRSNRKKAAAINLIGFASGFAPIDTKWGAAVQAIAVTAQIMLATTISGYSRELERDADFYAVKKLSDGGYNPRQLSEAFRQLQGTHDLESEVIFYNDHPKLEQRIADVRAIAGPGLEAPVTEARVTDYRIAVERAVRDSVLLSIDNRRYRSAMAAAQHLVDTEPASTEMHYLLGEAARALGPRTARPSEKEATKSGKKNAQKAKSSLTAVEEEKQLLSAAEGQVAWRENQQRSETAYRKALELDATNIKAHRGLGLLYEKAGRIAEALDAYRKYLESPADLPDRVRIERRIDALQKAH
jgi:predicted Zn-dependent protease